VGISKGILKISKAAKMARHAKHTITKWNVFICPKFFPAVILHSSLNHNRNILRSFLRPLASWILSPRGVLAIAAPTWQGNACGGETGESHN
jgi:hypothetical protein